MTDFRALILELAEALDHDRQCLMDDRSLAHPLADRARAALAEGETGPSDEELLRTFGMAKRDYCYEGPIDDWPKRAERAATLAGLHAVLARYGTTPPRPVPVAERLPTAEDCDAEGRCWFFHASKVGGHEWFLNEIPKVGAWFRWQSVTHWLPAYAIPVPCPSVITPPPAPE